MVILLSFVSVKSFSLDFEALRKSFVDVALTVYADSESLNQEFIDHSYYGRANDVLLLQLYIYSVLPDAEVERLLGLFTDEGYFEDIDYSDLTRGMWQPTLHITRMQALAKVYANPESKWFHEERVGRLLHSAIAFWGENRPICPNWWHNDIGVPRKLSSALLLLRDELSEEELAVGLRVLENCHFGMTGQNKLSLAGNLLMKGLLTDDEALVLRAREEIAEEICVAQSGEGIQPDWSYHQHGPQIQFGNYGLCYLDVLSFWMRVLKGSEIAFTEEQYEIVGNFLNEGLRWSIWKGMMDPSFCGRQLFKEAGRGKACALLVAQKNMDACFDSETEPAIGAKYFWKSDCGIFRTENWYASVRMHSERTVGFEFTNRENLGGWFSADGALLLMQDGREYEDIFAYWDWRKVPGVTAYDDGQPLKTDDSVAAKRNNSSHVGGVVTGNGSMLATMELARDGLSGLKSYFFLGDIVVALGSGIGVSNPSAYSLTTAIEQNKLLPQEFTARPREGQLLVDKGSNWAWHCGKGYALIDGGQMVVETAEQKGKWDLLEPAYHDVADSGFVFKCYVKHDVGSADNSYAYVVLPCCTVSKVSRFARHPRVKVLFNNSTLQAVKYRGCIYAVVHKPCSLRFTHGIRRGKSLRVEPDNCSGAKNIKRIDGPSFVFMRGRGGSTETHPLVRD